MTIGFDVIKHGEEYCLLPKYNLKLFSSLLGT